MQVEISQNSYWIKLFDEIQDKEGLTDAQIGKRIGCMSREVALVREGEIPMPMPPRIRLLDYYKPASVEQCIRHLLEGDEVELFDQAMNDCQKEQDNRLRPPARSIQQAHLLNEQPLWADIVFDLNRKLGSQTKTSDLAGLHRTAFSACLNGFGTKRFPLISKLKMLTQTNYLITDDVLLTLATKPAMKIILPTMSKRPAGRFNPMQH